MMASHENGRKTRSISLTRREFLGTAASASAIAAVGAANFPARAEPVACGCEMIEIVNFSFGRASKEADSNGEPDAARYSSDLECPVPYPVDEKQHAYWIGQIKSKPVEFEVVDASAPAPPPSAKAARRAEKLKAGLQAFVLDLSYIGNRDTPFDNLVLHVPPMTVKANDPSNRIVQITEAEASTIIDHLATEGFLDSSDDQSNGVDHIAKVIGPAYILTVLEIPQEGQNPPIARAVFYENLGWGAKMLERLDGLRSGLKGETGGEMDLLLRRLAGLRKAESR